MSSASASPDKFPAIYNDINVILRLVKTKESVSRFVAVMADLAALWSGYKRTQEMQQKNMLPFFEALISVVTELNTRIQVTHLTLINIDQERVTYMIRFLGEVHEHIQNYFDSGVSVSMYAYVQALLKQYNPPALSLLPRLREPALPVLPEDEEEEEEAFNHADDVVRIPGEDETRDETISSLLSRMKELSLEL